MHHGYVTNASWFMQTINGFRRVDEEYMRILCIILPAFNKYI